MLIIICFKGFRFLILSSTPPVRVEWNFNTTFIFLYIKLRLKYYFDFGNKLFFVIEWGCVACEGGAFFLPKNIPNLHSSRYMKKN